MNKIKSLIIPLIILPIFVISFNNSITNKFDKIKDKKDITSIKHTYNHILRDRGGVLKDKMFEDNDLILLGSSELSSNVDQNPINIFPFIGAEYDVSIFGRAHTQSLQHATMLSSTNNINSSDKIALVVSLQWFENNSGISGKDFIVNFSEYQFYKMFENDKISKENKKIYATRVNELLRECDQFVEEQIYASLYSREDIASKISLFILKPYYKFKMYMLEIKDKVQSYNEIKNNKDIDTNTELKAIEWESEYLKADKEGSSKVTNNDINVEDEYYDKYLREIYDSLKWKWKDVELLSSKELEDYQLFLNVSYDLGVKPLIILMPVNGMYYDYLGLTKEKREEYYNTVETMAKEKGFDVLNLVDKEYEKYYLSDVMHLGWKGWLNIDEEIFKYFEGK